MGGYAAARAQTGFLPTHRALGMAPTIRMLLALLALGAVLWVTGVARATEPVLVQRMAWIEPAMSATVSEVSRHVDRFTPVDGRAVHALGPDQTLWLLLRVQAPAGTAQRWGLEIPVSVLDFAALHQPAADGSWTRQQAGDTVPVAQWSRPGRYPVFDLDLPPGASREVLLQVRHQYPVGFAVRIAPESELEQGRERGYLLMGMVLGSLALMAVSCLILGAMHREKAFVWYAAHAAAMTLTIGAISGLAAQLLWSTSPRWANLAPTLLPAATAGINILFLRHLCGISGRHPHIDRAALLAGVAILVLVMAFPWVSQRWQVMVLVPALAVSALLTFVLGTLAWRRADPVGRWVVLAYLPLGLAVLMALLRIQGWITATWLSLEGVSVAAALAVPLLLLAVNARSSDRMALQARANRLTQQDALTGLLSAPAFGRQLKQAISGAVMRREAAAVALVDLVNLSEIRRAWGDAMAEQAVLRAVIKLQRFVRESEPAGRLGAGRFGLVFEGMCDREALQARLVQLVASGLAPTRGAELDVTLRFHVAAVLLGERVRPHEQLLRDLERLLDGMSSRTRRPIRFLDPDREFRPDRTDAPVTGDRRSGDSASGPTSASGNSHGASDPASASRP